MPELIQDEGLGKSASDPNLETLQKQLNHLKADAAKKRFAGSEASNNNRILTRINGLMVGKSQNKRNGLETLYLLKNAEQSFEGSFEEIQKSLIQLQLQQLQLQLSGAQLKLTESKKALDIQAKSFSFNYQKAGGFAFGAIVLASVIGFVAGGPIAMLIAGAGAFLVAGIVVAAYMDRQRHAHMKSVERAYKQAQSMG